MAAATETTWHDEPAITLRSGELAVTFLPRLGMTGVSLRYRGGEHLSVPGGPDALRAGSTAGLPLLAPWANRLAAWRYRAAGVEVDVDGMELHTDGNGLPIHGLLVGAPGWDVLRCTADHATARLDASIDVDAPAFPFPHVIELRALVAEHELTVETSVRPTGRRPVPIAFGWHPYLRLPEGERSTWTLRLPARRHLMLDGRGIPTGAETAEPAEAAPIASRTFDDLYALGDDRSLEVRSDGGAGLAIRFDAGYPYAQVWVPARRDFLALEPMTAPTNALVSGTAALVEPGDRASARFALVPS